jgi:hypothetical protein
MMMFGSTTKATNQSSLIILCGSWYDYKGLYDLMVTKAEIHVRFFLCNMFPIPRAEGKRHFRGFAHFSELMQNDAQRTMPSGNSGHLVLIIKFLLCLPRPDFLARVTFFTCTFTANSYQRSEDQDPGYEVAATANAGKLQIVYWDQLLLSEVGVSCKWKLERE